MPDVNLTPFMNLPAPEVGVEPGPQWATDLNNALTIIDQHNHSPGSGVQINPSGININTALAFNNNPAISLQSSVYVPQSSLATLTAVYVVGPDLYYNDANGNAIQITISGHVNSGNGSISGLVSPASASYSAPTFIWQSNVNTPANMDAGSYIFRNIVANSKGLTLSPPNAMGANYTITLPALPSVQSIMTLDAAGNMTAPYTVDNSTIVINSNVIKVGTITNSNIVDNTISGAKIQDGTITSAKFAAGGITTHVDTFTSSGTWTCPAGVTEVTLFGAGGGGAGGSGGGRTGASGAGGFGAVPVSCIVPVTPTTVYTVTIGAGGLRATNPTPDATSGPAGGSGQNSTFGTLATFFGALGGPGGAFPSAVNVFTPPTAIGFFAYGGVGSENELLDNANGNASFYAAGGAKGTVNAGASAGGGGGGAGFQTGGTGAQGAAANGNGRDAASTNTSVSSGGGGGSGGDDNSSATGGRGQPGGNGIIMITYPKFD